MVHFIEHEVGRGGAVLGVKNKISSSIEDPPIFFKISVLILGFPIPSFTTMKPHVDLVITFRASSKSSSKYQTQKDIIKAEKQYTRLLETLSNAGLKAVGRRGESLGHLLVFVWNFTKLKSSKSRSNLMDYHEQVQHQPCSCLSFLGQWKRKNVEHSFIYI